MRMWHGEELIYVDPLATTVGLCVIFFTALTLFYSWGYMPRAVSGIRYYVYILLTCVTALGVVFASNLIVLLVCWGLTGLFLYLLIGFGTKDRTPSTAQKAMIVIGGTDTLMMLGVILIGKLSGSLDIQQIRLSFDQPQALYAFLCLLAGIVAKVGAIPLHTWILDTAEDAPTPVTAFLPASLDKLLGIYLLARMVLDLFEMTASMYMVLLIIGAVTIVGAGTMMLIQQDFKRLLGHCAVSQIGYVLLGIGTGHPIGIAGGLFHMVNHAVYKSCLFFAGGAVERRAESSDLEQLGGMARLMPAIFVSFLIAALAVSGVPPLNGFASKWMIYQGIIDAGKQGGFLWIIWLVVAMSGSALTLAGMMKIVHAIFLGQPAAGQGGAGDRHKKTLPAIEVPPMLLALLCILFGVWAYALPLRYLILPILEPHIVFSGIWQPGLATILILVGIGCGVILYVLGRLTRTMRQTDAFIGGETLSSLPEMRVSGSAFYRTIRELPVFRSVYALGQHKFADPYQAGREITLRINRVLRDLHTGILPTYLSWCLLGMVILFYVLLSR